MQERDILGGPRSIREILDEFERLDAETPPSFHLLENAPVPLTGPQTLLAVGCVVLILTVGFVICGMATAAIWIAWLDK